MATASRTRQRPDIPDVGWPTGGRDDFSWLFGDRSPRHGRPLVARNARQVLPGVFSFDPVFLAFMRTLTDYLNEALPPEVDSKGYVGRTGVHTTFDRCRTVAGFSMNPMSFVPMDNTRLREEMGLTNQWLRPRDKEIFAKLWRIVFSSWESSKLHTPRRSTAGFPGFSYDAEWKRDYAVWALENVSRFYGAIDSGDYLSLVNDAGILPVYSMNKRGQVDDPGKKRMVMDLEYALSSGKSGHIYAADKRVVIDGVEYPDFSAERERPVQGGPWPVNCILQAIFGGHMKAMFARFPKTFHTTDPDEIAAAIEAKGDTMASDVSDYDRTMPRMMFDVMLEEMARVWHPSLVKLAHRMIVAPYYTRPLSLDGKRGVWVGDPFDDHSEVYAGNRSGWAATAITAKVNKVGDSLCSIDRLTGDVLETIEHYLDWKGMIALLNNGDDENAVGSYHTLQQLAKLREPKGGQYRDSYFKIEVETGHGYSGYIVSKAGGEVKLYNRINTFFEKIYCPERSIGGVMRSRWVVGILDRLLYNENHPAFDAALDCHQRAWREHMYDRHGDWNAILATANQQLTFELAALSRADREVLDDPAKLHYKYTDKDVLPEIVQSVMIDVPEEHVLKFARANYTGGIYAP